MKDGHFEFVYLANSELDIPEESGMNGVNEVLDGLFGCGLGDGGDWFGGFAAIDFFETGILVSSG